ncbi:apolipoprotein N-acyltransferase [Bauldia sp.]|uniref:apolipoprotein N-acyltransferase n=1 Tax=Bauldia sp. TaxID=2575872 RepID=UPI003BA88B7D
MLAFVAGALSSLAMAPFHAFPLLWITLPVFVWLIDGTGDGRRPIVSAALVGWWVGFGYFLGGLWWIGAAFLVEADEFAWALPLAVVILPAGLALFWGAGAALAGALWTNGWSRILLFAASLSAAEWLRGHILTGFPWNTLGYAIAPSPLLMQTASLIGLWGLTFVALIVFAAPAAWDARAIGRQRGAPWFAAFAAGLFLLHLGYGAVRLSTAPDRDTGTVTIRIVQPTLEQDEKWDAAQESEIVARYLTLSAGDPETPLDGIDVLVWPESAFPFLLAQRPDVLAAIGDLLPPGTTLITGAARGEPARGEAPGRVFNSVLVVTDDGEIVGAYDKVRLVPFGEFLPLADVLRSLGLRQVVALPGGFAPGSQRLTMALESAPSFSPLICYEIVFPGAVTATAVRPAWLLNLTNDGWFGDTPGPYQHFHQARLRAVEEGLPVIRAANTGISAVVDAFGRVQNELGLGKRGIVDGVLPPNLSTTIFVRAGDIPFLVMLVLALSIAGYVKFTFKLRKN